MFWRNLRRPIEDWSSGVLRNVGAYVPNYTAPYFRRPYIHRRVNPRSRVRPQNFELWSLKILLVVRHVETKFAQPCGSHLYMDCSQSAIVLLYTSLFVSWGCSSTLLIRRASARDPIRVCLFAGSSQIKRMVYSLNPYAVPFTTVYCWSSVYNVIYSVENWLLFADFNVFKCSSVS